MLEGYFSIEGRIRRWRFLLYALVLQIIIIPVVILLAVPAVNNARSPFIAGIIAVVGIWVFWAWAGFALVAKRLHDLDKSGWHYVWMFLVPGLLSSSFSVRWNGGGWSWTTGYGQLFGIVSVIAFLWLVLAQGSDGPNKYGYPP